jgi:hypothetical protein
LLFVINAVSENENLWSKNKEIACGKEDCRITDGLLPKNQIVFQPGFIFQTFVERGFRDRRDFFLLNAGFPALIFATVRAFGVFLIFQILIRLP